jgi:colanic acid/amylovoran biosynthesis protein
MSQSITILITNFHSAANAGDAASLDVTVSQLRRAFFQTRIIVSSDYPDESYPRDLGAEVVPSPLALCGTTSQVASWRRSLALLHGLLFCLASAVWPGLPLMRLGQLIGGRWCALLAAYREASLVVACPGNMFFTTGRVGWPFLTSALSAILAHLWRKPFYVMPQSLGPLRRAWERWLLSALYRRARLVFVREAVSLSLAQSMRIPADRLRFAPDPAFALPPVGRQQAQAFLARFFTQGDRACVGVTVISRMASGLPMNAFVPYYRALARSLAALVDRYGVAVCFFPQVTGPAAQEDDRLAASVVVGYMGHAGHAAVIVDGLVGPAMLKGLYGLMDCFVASRMHSGIFAVSMGVPTLFIGYLTKTRGLVQSLLLERWFVELDELDEPEPDTLLRLLQELWLNRAEVSHYLRTEMPIMAEKAQMTAHMIAEDYWHGRR